MRLFVALSIPGDVRGNLSSLIDDLRQADARPRWVNPENLHVTLKFIGEVPAEKAAAAGDALSAIRTTPSIGLEFRDLGFFPNTRKPSVVWIGIASSPDLSALALGINRALMPLGIPRGEKAFVPHLTIARFKGSRISPLLLAEVGKWKGHGFGKQTAREFHLMESKLKASGAEYTTLRTFPFAQEEPQGEEL